jgi:hypothetical protein
MERQGMAGPGETLGSPWPTLAHEKDKNKEKRNKNE